MKSDFALGPRCVARRHYRDAAIGLEHAKLHFFDFGDTVLSHSSLGLFLVNTLALHHIGQVLAVLDDHRGRRGEEAVKARYSVQSRNRCVRQHQREDEHKTAANRVVGASDGGLQRVGDQQDEDEVVQRELSDLSLAEYAQRNKQGDVDQYRTEGKLPSRDTRQKGCQLSCLPVRSSAA